MWFQTLPFDPEAPKISFKNGVLIMYGLCIPEDCKATLDVIFDEIYKYLKKGSDITISFKFDAINSSSGNMFVQFLTHLNQIRAMDYLIKSKRQISIIWNYPNDDEDMQELGKFYRSYSDNLAKKGKFNKIEFKLKNYSYA